MAISKYSVLDGIPMPDNLLLDRDLSSTLDFKKYLNIGFDIRNTEDRVIEHNKIIANILKNRTTLRLRDLNLLLESYLYTLLYSSTIKDLNNEATSKHFYKRKLVISDSYLTISNKHLEDVLYTFQSTWGGAYGSLAYNMYLIEDTSHYLSPSQIASKCGLYLFEYMKEGNDLISRWVIESISFINSSSEEEDLKIYQICNSIFEALELQEISTNLNFLSLYLPNLVSWYESYEFSSTDENRIKAYSILTDIISSCYKRGFSSELLIDLFYSFIHQLFPISFEELYTDLIGIRKSNSYPRGISIEEIKVKEFMEGISLSNEISLRDKSYQILRRLTPPGGYNTLLALVAITLINRAYILSHFSNTLFSETFLLDRSSSQFVALHGRVAKLMYYAGFTLKKSTLKHLVILGNNIIYLTGLENDTQAYIKDLFR